MSNESLHTVTIVFKKDRAPLAKYDVLQVRMTTEERNRLSDDFNEAGRYTGTYEVAGNDSPRPLVLRFEDVLYIN
jgi:hypothetical protein